MTSPESPSSLLERAADLIENLACGATAGPWERADYCDHIVSPTGSPNRARPVITGYDVEILPGDRAWIATLNPSVATPLVAWLRAEANTAKAWADTAVRWPGVPDSYRDAPPSEALKFARLILQES